MTFDASVYRPLTSNARSATSTGRERDWSRTATTSTVGAPP
ncbi:hypothetical protein [Halorussus caseinilyticus]|uniref:Uncharacterized protein n=1 Tax=Halorussus caseinilyticus TaxID=3034025 RepID=A0ABD5WKT6_9EURY